MRMANVDAAVALNPAPGRAMMSKSIALGLLGAGAILLAILLMMHREGEWQRL